MRNRRTLLVPILMIAGCYLSHPVEGRDAAVDGVALDVPGLDAPVSDVGRDVPRPRPELCCASACDTAPFPDGVCGLNICGQVVRPICAPPGGPADGCALLYADCDESSDCLPSEVCRPSDADRGSYVCAPPLPECERASGAACVYACTTDAECPAGASECRVGSAGTAGACSEVGFCFAP